MYNLSLVLNVVGCYHALHLVTERAKEFIWNNLRSLEVAIDGVVEEHVDLPLEVLLVLGKSLFVVNLSKDQKYKKMYFFWDPIPITLKTEVSRALISSAVSCHMVAHLTWVVTRNQYIEQKAHITCVKLI